MQIVHHGGFNQVTGSCHELIISEAERYLIDCGLPQGQDDIAGKDPEDLFTNDLAVSNLNALLITHCHLDHIGRIPYLLAAGFHGPIICTPATARLLPLVLADAVKVGISRDPDMIEAVLARLYRQLQTQPLNDWLTLSDNCQIRFQNAGHIMGSAYIECIVEQQWIVFSGDLGCRNTPLLPDPTPLERADWLLLESTYGDRNHESRLQRQHRLKAIIQSAINDRGAVLIPAFSLGRTQELLYELEGIWHELTKDEQTGFPEVVLDSPLAQEITNVYSELSELWDAEAKQRLAHDRHPLDFSHCHVVEDHDSHLALVNRLASTAEPVIIIAASGMCSGGRIVNYLEALLPDARTDVLFVGYQAHGTPGRALQHIEHPGQSVYLNGKTIVVNAAIHTLTGYSAHAEQQELLDFIGNAQTPVKKVRLIHGEPAAQQALAKAIHSQFNIPVETADGWYGE